MTSGTTRVRPTSVPVVMVSFNRPQQCERAVGAFLGQTVECSVIVVDGSTEEAAASRIAMLADYDRVTVLRTDGRTLGFTGNANLGLGRVAEGGAEVALLCPDDAFPEDDAVARMLARLEDDVAIVGADDGAGSVGRWMWHRGWFVVKPGDPFYTSNPEWVLGHCLLLRMTAVSEVGLEDERIWAYGDEVSLCLRVVQRRWRIALAQGALVANTGVASMDSALVSFLTARNSILLAHDFGGWPRAWGRAAVVLLRAARWLLPHRGRAIGFQSSPKAAITGVVAAARGRWGTPPESFFG